MEVKLWRVPPEEKSLLFDMMQVYIAEFSRFEPVEPDEKGIYPYDAFDAYWRDPARIPFFITVDGQNAGLILVNRNHYVRLWRESRSIAEFFVLPAYRRMGVGCAAARLLTESMGGWWQLMMHPKNLPSHTFWRRTFQYPGALHLRIRRGPRWYDGGLRGQVMTFKAVKDYCGQ
ncbi:MAG: GNAT family N-acetyltransferase [Clostridia bacterium]|nr:GNAT family N-acetyltransferase [Clostridia bacterium]